jgi:hypothetical protein
MPKRTKSFEVEYTYFKPGTLVTPIHRNTTLEFSRDYCVVECYEPTTYMGLCTCRVRETWGERYEHMSLVFSAYLHAVTYPALDGVRTRVVVPNG